MAEAAKEVPIGKVSDLAPGKGKVCAAGGIEVALFNVAGTFYAIDNVCAHLGGPLGEGVLLGCIVTCPWHNWEYDVRTGETVMGDEGVRRYEVKVEGDALTLVIPPEPS